MSVIRLLGLRGAALLLRPAAVLLENALVSDGHVLVLVVPVAMLALTVSSIPVHRDFFRSYSGHPEYERLAYRYAAALGFVTLLSLVVMIPLLAVLPLGLSLVLLIATCFVFVTEKLADETSRALEFRKAFVHWFLAQALRSGWFIVPIVASLLGADYEMSFLIVSGLAMVVMWSVFWRVTRLRLCLSRSGYADVRDNSVFLIGSLLPASYRQIPRILVARLYPEQAHVFLAVAQLCQSVSLLFNVRLQIPYRKLIARRTMMFERRLRPTMRIVAIVVLSVGIAYFVMSFLDIGNDARGMNLARILVPIMIAEALAFAILASYLGYIPWLDDKRKALETYLLCIGAVGFLVGIWIGGDVVTHISLLGVPSITIFIGSIWLAIIVARHFRYH